ncbi:uncharacterized protein ACO6RY_12116 [Pungitius sinensis]
MGHLTLVAVIGVLFSLFMEAEANPFVYSYERLRIGGLIFSGFCFFGGIAFLFHNKCSTRNKKVENDSEI